MKRLTIAFFAVLAIGFWSCTSSTETQNEDGETTVDSAVEVDPNVRGTAFEMVNVEMFDDFITSMEGIDTMDAVVKGKVESVCKKKGCWMNVVSEDGERSMFVQFQDYGFFMPLDLAGQTVTMKGTAYRSVTSVDELQHYAEDDGKSKEEIAAITEPKEELKFMASGVVIGE